MDKKEQIQTLPTKRIKPVDGMAVTADVWDAAHDYHLQSGRGHAALFHGSGIVTGLEVIASDPADTAVYIKPGVAVDALGRTIVLPQPVAYDIGTEMEGTLYLLLSYSEGRPRAGKGAGNEDGPLYVQAEFSIAARNALPGTPVVELARVRRKGREAAFLDAANPAQPAGNELDLRFRREIGAPRDIDVAVCYTDKVKEKKHGLGAMLLARSLNQAGRFYVTVDNDVRLAPGIESNTLIYVVGEGDFELSSGQINGLKNYLNKGKGTLLLESVDAAAEKAFHNLLDAMDIETSALQTGDSLLVSPYLFAAPPAGFAGDAGVSVAGGVILSNGNYGLVWQGEVDGGTPSREQLRSAVEWGTNMLVYAWDRFRRK